MQTRAAESRELVQDSVATRGDLCGAFLSNSVERTTRIRPRLQQLGVAVRAEGRQVTVIGRAMAREDACA